MRAFRRGSIRRSVVARSPRFSLALPALIVALLALLTARAGLAIARDASSPEDGAPDAPADGTTSSGQPPRDGQDCLPSGGPRQVAFTAAAEAPGATKRPACPVPPNAAIPSSGPAEPGDGLLGVAAGLGPRPDLEPLSPSAPCSQRAPPSPAA